jgi:DNA-binding transcriptional regulator YhcF (GntR family)
MNNTFFFENIHVDAYSCTPKYLQLADSILDAIAAGKMKQNVLLPSLNELTYHLDISRETADKGYKRLQKMGILKSVPGKGHYIHTTKVNPKLRICLLVNKISEGKRQFYESLIKGLGKNTSIDFYVFDNDFSLFKSSLLKKENYSHYLIMPYFLDCHEKAEELINQLPKDKLVLLGKKLEGIKGEYIGIYEDFSKDIFYALEKTLNQLYKYHTIKLVFPQNSYYPDEIIHGFESFCMQYAFEREVIGSIRNEKMSAGTVYICLNDKDLVSIIEMASENKMEVGKDLGIISYNETPLKKHILNGITTISTDYEKMGDFAASMIMDEIKKEVFLEFKLILRPSL